MNPLKNKYLVSFTLASMLLAAALNIRSVAQSTKSAAPNTAPTNVMAAYVAGVKEAVFSGTEATNLTDAELSRLMNESIKTNLAAQLWFRHAMTGHASELGKEMANELRALESLRAGRTNDAIRELENSLDSNIFVLSTLLRLSDESKTFKPTPGPRKSLEWAREYRLKHPYKSGDSATDEQVKHGLSYLDKK